VGHLPPLKTIFVVFGDKVLQGGGKKTRQYSLPNLKTAPYQPTKKILWYMIH
jgi:hypothetical protein